MRGIKGIRDACTVAECDTLVVARGLCDKHYHRWKKHGDTSTVLGPLKDLPIAERFWMWVDKSGGPLSCWEWQGHRGRKGYGQFGIGRAGPFPSHRIAYELAHGYIDEALQVMHGCDNPPCNNPFHLVQGTNFENSRQREERGRGWQSKVTHCRHGHPYDEENTYYPPGRNERACRACKRARRAAGGE